MNNIIDVKRNSLLIDTTSHLMTINLMGKSIEDFDATPHVKSWLDEAINRLVINVLKKKSPMQPAKIKV